jgi:leader peptidase (prepilin peptidase) / N-methyltransferase
MAHHWIYILFVFLMGACVGSFLNVVVWRLPRGESLSTPPSHCPKCGKNLKWYDNVPILGWIKLGGRCRFCRAPISVRYPIVETVTALLFVGYYVAFFMAGVETCPPKPRLMFEGVGSPAYLPVPLEWPFFAVFLFLLAALLAASLIDAELFEIPYQIPLCVAVVGVLFHAIADRPHLAGALNLLPRADGSASPAAALAAGGTLGLLASILLRRLDVLSFPEGEPIGPPVTEAERTAAREEAEREKRKAAKKRDDEATGEDEAYDEPLYTRREVRREMGKEMLFLLPPLGLAIAFYLLTAYVPAVGSWWASATRADWLSGLLGSLFGGLVGGLVVWVTRILGTLGFGRLAMGMGDVDLMFAVGTVLGAGAATVAFFLAPFFGIAIAGYMIVTGTRRELPYGPYLSLGTACVMLTYCPIERWLRPGIEGLAILLGGGGQGA